MALSVLIVDDSSMSRKLLHRALPAGWDATVQEAANGGEALAALRAGNVDVTFLDLTMPVMSGYQVLECIRDENLETRVIVVTADIQPKAETRVRELGALAMIKKPIEAGRVHEVLEQFGLL